MTTMRLQRLHFSSKPSPPTLAMSCPHSQRVSALEQDPDGELVDAMSETAPSK